MKSENDVFAGKILAAVEIHLHRWEADDPEGRHPLVREGFDRLIAEAIEPALGLVDGVFFGRFSGYLPEYPIPSGRRVDGKTTYTWLRSIAANRRYAEWFAPVRALAERTFVVMHDGIAMSGAAEIACAADRYAAMGVHAVAYDSQGQNASLGMWANCQVIEDLGIIAMVEPAPLPRLQPAWLGDRPCATNHERWAILDREMGESAPGGIDWYNGTDDGPWSWDADAARRSFLRGRAVAVPTRMITPELVSALKKPAVIEQSR